MAACLIRVRQHAFFRQSLPASLFCGYMQLSQQARCSGVTVSTVETFGVCSAAYDRTGAAENPDTGIPEVNSDPHQDVLASKHGGQNKCVWPTGAEAHRPQGSVTLASSHSSPQHPHTPPKSTAGQCGAQRCGALRIMFFQSEAHGNLPLDTWKAPQYPLRPCCA